MVCLIPALDGKPTLLTDRIGYLSLFSVVWPLTACSFLVNNWVEARSDAMKIAANSQRPIPWRADSIGPWLNSLGFLSWLGSITSAALVYLFHACKDRADGSPWDIRGWALLLSILFAEHVYLVVQFVVRGIVRKLDSPGLQKEKAERFAMRKQLLERMTEMDVSEETTSPGMSRGEKITREALEEETRKLWIAGGGRPEQLYVCSDIPDEVRIRTASANHMQVLAATKGRGRDHPGWPVIDCRGELLRDSKLSMRMLTL